MSQYRYILFSLLFAGMTCAQAQTPIVKVNPGASECDVRANAGDPIFQLDATGNVIVTGTMTGAGCSTVSGGGTPTFGLNPPASGVVINGGSSSVGAGSVATVPFTYQAYNAPSCTVGQPTTSGSCPAITAASGGCTGTGAQLGCAPTGATLSIPASLTANCSYSVTANCSGVTSSAVLTVTTSGGGGGTFGTPPAACTGAGAPNPIGLIWQRTTAWTWLPGQGTVQGVDATDYRNIYSAPGGGQQPWPSGSSGVKPTVTIAANNYLSIGFTVPSGATANPKYFNVNSGSQPVAVTISECPGDFGQAGTHITNAYCKSDRTGTTAGGLQTFLGTQLGTCSLLVGHTYYLNFLDASLPTAGSTTQPTSACTSGTCGAQVEMTSN
jgi:hypothetical protein